MSKPESMMNRLFLAFGKTGGTPWPWVVLRSSSVIALLEQAIEYDWGCAITV